MSPERASSISMSFVWWNATLMAAIASLNSFTCVIQSREGLSTIFLNRDLKFQIYFCSCFFDFDSFDFHFRENERDCNGLERYFLVGGWSEKN